MTFIIAVQLEDSIIVTADNRSVVVKEDETLHYRNDDTSKFFVWKNGIITGSGEVAVIHRAVEFLLKLADSKIETLPKCLKISRQLRELEVDHFHIQTTKLLYSDYTQAGVQLYSIQPDGSSEYQLQECKTNEIILWLFNPDVSAITQELKDLYASLKPRKDFDSPQNWLNHYIDQFSQIYKKQAQTDPMMSTSFDVFFQSTEDYIYGPLDNTQDEPLVFSEVPLNLEPT